MLAPQRYTATAASRLTSSLAFLLLTTFHALNRDGNVLCKMPITFGSVGDIIAIALIVKDLIEALEKSRGASAEYKALIRDLRLLEDILSKVEVLANTHETTFELAALYQTVRRTTEICRESIVAFKARLTKYEPTLGNDKANKVKSTLSKIRFHVGEKEDVAKFRAEIAGHVASLNVLISATSW